MRLLLPAALLLACTTSVPAMAQTEPQPDIEALLNEGDGYAQQALAYYKRAMENFAEFGSDTVSCYNAGRAVQYGIRARNRVMRARKAAAADPELRGKLDGAYHDSSRMLNTFKRTYNERCDGEPFELNPE